MTTIRKRLISFVCVLAMMFTTIGVCPENTKANTQGFCGFNMTWQYSNGVLTITGTGMMDNYQIGTAPWYLYRKSINKIVISSGVTSIGNAAFRDLSYLSEITMPNTLTRIGHSCFYFCESLTNITIPDSVTSIGNDTFAGCDNLATVKMSKNVTEIPENMFWCCFNLTQVTLQVGLTHISKGAFSECTKLRYISIPSSVISIGEEAFMGCESATSLTIPNGVTSIGDRAFSGCGLSSIIIPSGVTSIGEETFSHCSNVTSLKMSDNVTSIGKKAFWYCENLTNITVSNNVTSIGDYAFCHCSKFTKITIPGSVKSIGVGAFNQCENLTEITIPDSVTSIGEFAFYWCKQLKKVKLSNNIKCIDNYVFEHCNSLTEITIPNNVTTIGNGAFYWCEKLPEIDIPDGTTKIGNQAFYYCKELKEIEIPASVIIIGDNAFSGCYKLNNINVSIQNKYYISIDGVLYDKKVKDILTYPCGKEGVYTVPTSVAYIDEGEFFNCGKLTEIIIPQGITNISDETFRYCYNLEKITIPRSITSIGRYTFDDCTSLTDVYYEGSKAEWDSLEIGDYNDLLINANIHYGDSSDTGSNESDISDLPKATLYQATGSVTQKDSGVATIELSYNEQDLAKNSYIYNHDLGTFAMGLSTIAYSTDTLDMKNALRGLGYKYENIKFYPDEMGRISPHYIAHKTVNLNNTKTNIILVAIRGTYNKEWIDNFDPGYGAMTHKGFQTAADFVYNDIISYRKEKGIEEDRTKIIVTGHSRGAAVANLVGRKLIDVNTNIPDNNIFVYTFATPNVTADENKTNTRYRNIFNIVNPEDFVTKVMFSAWGYGRYGITYVLPSKDTDSSEQKIGNHVNYSEYLAKLKDLFSKYRPKDEAGYTPYKKGMLPVSEYIANITSVVKSTKEYYEKCLNPKEDCNYDGKNEPHSLYTLFTYFLGYFKSNDDEYKKISYSTIVDAIGGKWNAVGRSTVLYFAFHQVPGEIPYVAPEFACSHYAETYLAAMNILTAEELQATRRTMKGIINCPVDISIKNKDGKILGQIINNEIVQDLESEISFAVDGDSKSFIMPKEAGYTIELTGNDSGHMDYSFVEMDPDSGESIRKFYNNVPVEKGVSYVQEMIDDCDVASSVLTDKDGNELEYTGIYSTMDSEKLSVNVTVEGIGAANSFSNLLPGDYVNLCASTDDYNSFLGWYNEEGELIAKEEVYGISVSEDLNLIAKFTNIKVSENETTEETTTKTNLETDTVTNADIVDKTETQKENSKVKNPKASKIKKISKGKKALKVSWKKIKGVTGYQIQYSTSKKFKKPKKVNIKKAKTTTKTIKKLKAKKKYYVRIRTYIKVNGKKYYSSWSKAKSAKTK